MKETQATNRTPLLLILAAATLLALLAGGLALAGRALAQSDTPPPQEPVEVTRDTVERIVADGTFVFSAGTEGGWGFPFEVALRKLAAEGAIALSAVDSIMDDLSGLTDAVDYQSSTTPDGLTEVLIDVTIDSGDATVRPAMEQALDNAVAAGLLTADQAAGVLAQVDAAPDDPFGPGGEVTIVEASLGSPAMTEMIQGRLRAALTAGTITADEADVFQSILDRLLAAE